LFSLLGSTDADNLVFPLNSPLYLKSQDAKAVPEVGTMNQWIQKVAPGSSNSAYDLVAWEAGVLFQTAMSHITGDPTRAKLLAAVHGITSFTADGLLPPDTNVGQKKAPICTDVAGVHGKTFVHLSPPKAGSWDCKGIYVSSSAG
jgi:hypothetical protein